MPDTQRTLAALQALLADNVGEDVSPQDVRDFLVSSFPTVASRKVTPTYGPTISTDLDLGQVFVIIVTDAVAFTIPNPTNAPSIANTSPELIYDIYNNSGGAMGVITWGSAFKLAGAFTNPADTMHRFISFRYDGTNWREASRSPADQPN